MASDRADWAAVALLMPAMRAGQDLHVGGVMTDVLLHQMNGDLQVLLGWLQPGCAQIRVSADDTRPARAAPPAVAMGFSGGVDSFDALREYFLEPDVPDALRVTHLLNNNVGAHGTDGAALWNTRLGGWRRWPISSACRSWRSTATSTSTIRASDSCSRPRFAMRP